MEPLLKRIADQITDRVEERVNVQTVFKLDSSKAMELVTDCRKVLDKWEQCYLTTREKIEESGADHRWVVYLLSFFKKILNVSVQVVTSKRALKLRNQKVV
jgi:hypothetical protein